MVTPFEPQTKIKLAPYTSWLIGGEAEYFCLPQTIDECRSAIAWANKNGIAITVLGGGSNVLVSDSGVRGLVMCLRKLSHLETCVESSRLQITALAGVGKSELLKVFLKHQLAPALFLAGLPGDVGGGVTMNAGVGEQIVPREFVEIVDWVEVLSLTDPTQPVKRFNKNELQWSYRHCHGWEPGLIVRVGISWAVNPEPDILQRVRDANKVRLQKQPLHLPSCGSVFVNPPGHKSGQLIDQCGLRGFRIGDAQVSEKHANFIVNLGSATAVDTHRVIEHVKAEVKAKTGVQLNTEVRYLGEWPDKI